MSWSKTLSIVDTSMFISASNHFSPKRGGLSGKAGDRNNSKYKIKRGQTLQYLEEEEGQQRTSELQQGSQQLSPTGVKSGGQALGNLELEKANSLSPNQFYFHRRMLHSKSVA